MLTHHAWALVKRHSGLTNVRRASAAAVGMVRMALRLTQLLGLLLVCLPISLLERAMMRRRRRWPSRFLAGVGAILGLDISVRGSLPTGKYLILANHVSWLDIPVLATICQPVFVAHDGLKASALIKHLCRLADTVFIARHAPASVSDQIDDLRQALIHHDCLALFPEGTTSDGTRLLPFKSSLLAAIENSTSQKISVVPVWIDYGVESGALAWLGEESGLSNAQKILARHSRLKVTAHVLPAIHGPILANRKALAQEARHAIENAKVNRPLAYSEPPLKGVTF